MLASLTRIILKVLAGIVLLALAAPTGLAGDKKVPVVDAHLHCFAGNKDPRFPYHPKAPYQPEQPATPEHLLKCMAEGRVDYALVVHPEPYQDDHRYLEHCLKVGGAKLKGTCLFFADRADAVEKMTELVRRFPGQIVTLRIHAYAPDRLPPFDKPEQIRRLWKAAGDLGLAVQLHLEPRYAPKLEPFIKEFPRTTVIVDHLGRPFQGTPEEHAVIVRWARFENVVMKIAAIPEKRAYPHRDIRPVIDELVKAYGPKRLIYGGGFDDKATGPSYRAHRESIRDFLKGLSPAEQDLVLGGNAARLFGFQAKGPDPTRWEKTIADFEKQDARAPFPAGGVVFTGSSSIALWKDLPTSFPGHNVLNRGFGGSSLPEVNHFLDRLVLKHKPRAVVLFCGGNDLAMYKHSPEQVLADFQTFVEKTHAKAPETRILYLSIHLPPARLAQADNIERCNALIAAACKKGPQLAFVDIHSVMLDGKGKPNPDLYRDPLHPNEKAYALWAEKIRPFLK